MSFSQINLQTLIDFQIQMGVYLSEPATKKNIQLGVKNGMSFCSAEMQGWRKNMQDAAIHNLDIGDGNSLFAVFDGHGGPQVSQYVQTIFIEILTSLKFYKQKKYVQALDQAFKKVDEKIISEEGAKKLRAIRQDQDSNEQVSTGTGCTANVVLITPTHYYAANAGDSRSVLCRQGGVSFDLSNDHKPESPQEQARIRKAGGYIQMGRVNGGLNLTRSFGDFGYKKNTSLSYAEQMITCKPDIKTVERKKTDQFIVLGCDGIWERYVDNSQGLINIVSSQIKTKKDDQAILTNLLDDLLAKDTSMGIGCDNMTAILVRLNQ